MKKEYKIILICRHNIKRKTIRILRTYHRLNDAKNNLMKQEKRNKNINYKYFFKEVTMEIDFTDSI